MGPRRGLIRVIAVTGSILDREGVSPLSFRAGLGIFYFVLTAFSIVVLLERYQVKLICHRLRKTKITSSSDLTKATFLAEPILVIEGRSQSVTRKEPLP